MILTKFRPTAVRTCKFIVPWLISVDLIACGTVIIRFLIEGPEGLSQAFLHAAGASTAEEIPRVLGNVLLAFVSLFVLTLFVYKLGRSTANSDGDPRTTITRKPEAVTV